MITIRRGTTNEFVIVLNDGEGNAYSIGNGDNLIFGVKKNAKTCYAFNFRWLGIS